MQDDNQDPVQNQNLDLLSIGDASEYLGISIDTLRRWEKRGRIEPLRSPGGHRYFKKSELDALFGKRYTRDEETERSTKEKNYPDTNQNLPEKTVDNQQTDSSLVAPITTQQSPGNQEEQAVLSPLPSDDIPNPLSVEQPASPEAIANISPQTNTTSALPAWRTVKEEVVIEEKISVETNINTQPDKPTITDQPSATQNFPQPQGTTKEIQIPKIDHVRVVSEKEEVEVNMKKPGSTNTAAEAYIEQQKASILTPITFAKQGTQSGPVNTQPTPVSTQNLSEPKVEDVQNKPKPVKTKMDPSTRKAIAITLFIIGLVLASFAWYSLWKSSQIILSPVAN